MLLLLDASLFVFFNFLQVFLWISIPALLIGMLVTTVMHYRDKRKKQKSLEGSLIFKGEGSITDYSDVSLIPLDLFLHGDKEESRKIMNYLSQNNARYIAIQKDFKILIITHDSKLKEHFSDAILVEQDMDMISRARVVSSW